MRIGLDLGDVPAYFDLLSFLPPAEYGALLDAAGFRPDESPVAVTGTADPLLFDWRRVHQPVRCDDDQRAALAACLEASPNGLVFTGPKGGRLRQSNFRDVWYRAREAVGPGELSAVAC